MRRRLVVSVALVVGSWLLVGGAPPSGAINNVSYFPYMAQDITSFGNAGSFGSTGPNWQRALPNIPWLNAANVGMAVTPTDQGYWQVGADGGVFNFGDAPDLGSLGGTHLSQPIVGMAATPSGKGFWLVAADGGVFTFGDAGFAGSLGGLKLNQPIVGMAVTSTGKGYWLVAADGGVFTFGDAGFAGSLGGLKLNQPIVGMAATPTGRGYWLAAADGGVFTLGDAAFQGALASYHSNQRVVAIVATHDGGGYWLESSGFCTPLVGTTGPVTVSGAPAPPVAPIAGVLGMTGCREQATHTNRQQILFKFSAPTPAVLSFDARYVTTPTPGPSGMPVQIAGHAFLEVTVHGATDEFPNLAFSNKVSMTIGVDGPPPPYILAVQQTEDFEGVVRWVIALDQVRPFFVGQVSYPTDNTNNLLVELG